MSKCCVYSLSKLDLRLLLRLFHHHHFIYLDYYFALFDFFFLSLIYACNTACSFLVHTDSFELISVLGVEELPEEVMTPEQATEKYREYMSAYEIEEIKHYPQVN